VSHAEQIRGELCKRFPQEFARGYQYGLTGDPQPPCDVAGYPTGFHTWDIARQNSWYSGFNLGYVQRRADNG
jgi:hypothetical protein